MFSTERVESGSFFARLAGALVVVALSPLVGVSTSGAAGATSHVIVKLKPARMRSFLDRHGLSALSPVHAARAAMRVRTGLTDAGLTSDIRRRFAVRARRRAGSFPSPDLSRTYRLETAASPGPETDALLAQLAGDPDVEYAEKDELAAASLVPNDPYFSSTGTWGQAYADLYGLKKIGADVAWDSATGEGVTVAVIDTGIDDTHADIASNVWTNAGEIPGNGIDDDGNGYVDDVRGWDFVGANANSPAPDADPRDGHGHGTHVAGTIAAEGNNGIGVIGVAWKARVMAVKGLDNAGSGYHSQLASAIVYAADNGADVINASWGGTGTTQTLQDAVQYAASQGVVFVAAAGNSAMDARTFYPAAYPSVITVAATDSADALAYFSNWGPRIDVAAPGVDILSLRATGTSMGTPVGTGYTRASGTSMASPHVAGLAALVLGRYPTYSTEQVRQALRASASDIGSTGFDTQFGYGRIDAAQAVTFGTALESRILDPASDGSAVTAPLAVIGKAQGAGFASYELAFGAGAAPSSWTILQTSTAPVSNAPLGTFDAGSVTDGLYTLRLTTRDAAGHSYVDRRQVVVDYVRISRPVPPSTPAGASMYKPGAAIAIEGTASGASFSRFRVEWARGVNPASGWSASGVTLAGGGLLAVADGPLATWDTTGLTVADFYTVRLIVDDAGFSSEGRTLVYLEPSLLSTYWPRLLHKGTWSDVSAHVAQDANGQSLLTVGTYLQSGGERVWKFSPDGSSLVVVDDVLPYGSNPFQVASIDLDGQPGAETLTGQTNFIHVIRPDGTTYSLAAPPGHSLSAAVPVVAELDGVPGPEVVAVATSWYYGTGRLQAWHADGTPLGGAFPVAIDETNQDLDNTGVQRVVVGDLRGDGQHEIVVADGPTSSTFSLRVFGADGTAQPFTSPAFDGRLRRLAVADLDGDGTQEVLVLAYGTSMVLHVLGADGTEKPGWPVTLTGGDPGLAVADLDRDGKQEVIVTCAYTMYALRFDGQPFSPAWPLAIFGFYFGPPVVGDLDGDGIPEIVVPAFRNASVSGGPLFPFDAPVSSGEAARPLTPAAFEPPVGVQAAGDVWYDDYRLFVLRRDGTQMKSWQLLGIDGQRLVGLPVPLLGDVDADGKTDIVVSTAIVPPNQFLVEDSVLTVIATGAPYNAGTMDWPLVRHDAANTCAYSTDRTPPSVTLTAPAPEATLTDVTTVSATASDDVYVRGVQFRVDGEPIGAEDTTAPFGISWNPRASGNGPHTLTAVARDTGGNLTTSAPVHVTVDIDLVAPSAAITSPSPGTTAAGPITVTADASDDRGLVTRVELWVDSTLVGTDTSAPYSFDWDARTASDGGHALVAKAYDPAGNAGPSAPVTVTVVVPPTVSLTAPAPGATLSGSTTLAAQASDNSGVVRVEFYAGSVLVGTDTASPWSVTWNALLAADGPYTLTARAYDAAGNTGASAGVPVTVSHPPAVSITSPAAGTVVGAPIVVTASASDAGGIDRVELYVDGLLRGTGTVAPYAFGLDPWSYADGGHTLFARAYDTAGHLANTVTVPITVAVAPTASLTAPVSGSVVAGTVTLAAEAADNTGVVRVEFYVDGSLAATDTAAPWSASLGTWAHAEGAHTLSARAYDAAGNVGLSTGVPVTIHNDLATYDATLKVPRCTSIAGACDSGVLLVGRGSRGPEPNQPNTINSSCLDGTSGTYHVDESNDHIRIATLDGSTLAYGKTARIEATVWAYTGYSTDKLDLYYATNAANPSWTFLTTLTPTAAGAQTLSATYSLPYGALQAVRTHFRYGGSASPCSAGTYDDYDDIVFAVDVPPDAAPPTVTITAPVPGSTVATAPVIVTADATDDVGVTGVELYANGVLVGYDGTAPYSFSWAAADGSYSLVAKAYDPAGNVAASGPVTVAVSAPPTTYITSPVPGSTVTGPVTVSVQATDNTAVTRVEFFVDGSLQGTDTTAPYSFSWNAASTTDGTHTLATRAYDAAGNVGSSPGAPVTVSVPPTTSITSPAPGSTVSGVVTVTAVASDNTGVSRVELYVDSVLKGIDGTAPYSFSWDTAGAAPGSHTLKTTAYDLDNRTGSSATVIVQIAGAGGGAAAVASYDPVFKAPRCAAAAISCDSGSLLNGRATLGPEPSAPNTRAASTCADGVYGSYHSDESNDRIRVLTVDGTPLAAGKTVRIEATVWAYSGAPTSDKLDLYYAADASASAWTYVTTLTPTAGGAQVLSATYTLPVGAVQAVRAHFRYGGTAAACGTGSYDDHDDLVFAVQ